MKNLIITAAATLLVGLTVPANAQQNATDGSEKGASNITSEINYDAGELGYASLRQGRYLAAIEQIKAESGERPRDPAKLLNLGHAHSKLGQADQAREYYKAALKSRQSFDIILADGRVMNSRSAARVAIRQLNDISQ